MEGEEGVTWPGTVAQLIAILPCYEIVKQLTVDGKSASWVASRHPYLHNRLFTNDTHIFIEQIVQVIDIPSKCYSTSPCTLQHSYYPSIGNFDMRTQFLLATLGALSTFIVRYRMLLPPARHDRATTATTTASIHDSVYVLRTSMTMLYRRTFTGNSNQSAANNNSTNTQERLNSGLLKLSGALRMP